MVILVYAIFYLHLVVTNEKVIWHSNKCEKRMSGESFDPEWSKSGDSFGPESSKSGEYYDPVTGESFDPKSILVGNNFDPRHSHNKHLEK